MKKLTLLLFTICCLLNTTNASTLNMSITSSPIRLNTILANDSASSEISGWIFNGLFKYDKNGQVTTDLASSYKFIDSTHLVINLKKNVLWQDGKKFTADDVIFTYEKINDPKVFTTIKSYFKEVKSLSKINNYTVEVVYKKPYFKALEIWMFGIIPKHILKDEKDLMTSSFNKHPIGTGPYKIDGFKLGSDIRLYAFDKYFEGRPKIDELNFKFLPDANTSFLYLKQGKLDLGGLSPLQIDRQIDKEFEKHYQIIEKPAFSYDYLGFNLKKKKFQDIRVRRALSLAINREEIIDILFFGHGKVCNGPFLPGTFAYDDTIKPIKQNIKEAKRLLKLAGYDENHPLSFEVITNTGNDIRINATQIIQYQLAKIGVKMKIRVMEWQAFLNTVVHPKNFEAIVLGWNLALMPDAYPLWHSESMKKGGFNLVSYSNKEVDELIVKGATTIDKKKLSKIYKKIFRIIAHDTPYLFLYIPNSITVVSKKIKNIEPSFIGITHNQKDWIKEDD
ncbi:extracellular solute-binding protein family 5 [Arcobacter nitrofigilis DSM 7299]|uniref:Extracellular solute-binding protein family 5 n=1 Tax=Arcobacter nitrofigilis (strain ATCC 33309 / DSM 7299 / CCUG 15893 / LMG 7604 / NCTC 12251 / CI) TaxID=572480 RepID=D5V4Z3_ARCNC|nr:peptide-binding protein [Arcobacter nitrofigilis]ADG91955.1 extracellular solute-binding protein family 5 [Arcobacter nitrofigilis DSM 7299]